MANDVVMKIDDPQEVVIHKQTTIQTFSSEQELQQLVAKGEWEMLLNSEIFQKWCAVYC